MIKADGDRTLRRLRGEKNVLIKYRHALTRAIPKKIIKQSTRNFSSSISPAQPFEFHRQISLGNSTSQYSSQTAIDTLWLLLQHSPPVTTPADKSVKTDLVLVNPAAGAGRGRNVLARLQSFAKERDWRVEFQVPQSAERFAQQTRAAVAENRKRIFIVGGDGTFQLALNSLQSTNEIALGIIPAGAGNDLASALGLSVDPIEATSQLLEGEPRLIDVARVRTSEGTQRLYMAGGGVGLDSEAMHFAGGVYKNLRGRARYLLAAVRAFANHKPMQITIWVDGANVGEVRDETLLVGILNTPSYGAGLRMAPQALVDDGKLDLVWMGDLSLSEVLAILPALASKGELRAKRLVRQRVEHVRLETDRPCLFQADGEIVGSTPVEIEIMPKAARLLCPRELSPKV
jgi:diacylglycerol kinase (ATP)